MASRKRNPITYWMYTYQWPTGDRCNCYRHETRTDNRKRCSSCESIVELTDPDRPDGPHRSYCLDCWITCRDENTTPHPRIQKNLEQAKRDGMTLMAIGC